MISENKKRDIWLIINIVVLIYAGSLIVPQLPFFISALWELVSKGAANANLQWDIVSLVPIMLQVFSVPAFGALVAMLVINVLKNNRKLFIVLDVVAIFLIVASAVVVDVCLFALPA